MTSIEKLTRWVKTHCPKELLGSTFAYSGGSRQTITDPAFQTWFDACQEHGFTVPDWPEQYGGAGFDKQQVAALREAFRTTHAPVPLFGNGKEMLGPMLLELGTDDQKSRHLPRIASGEVRWCQGYSEPGAGSDLASLQTRDHFACHRCRLLDVVAGAGGHVDQLIAGSQAERRAGTVLVSVFAAMALVLVVAGVYSVIMQAVVQRRAQPA